MNKKIMLTGIVIATGLTLAGCTATTPVTNPSSSTTPEATTSPATTSQAGEQLTQFAAMTIPETDIRVGWMGEGTTVEFENGVMRGTATIMAEYATSIGSDGYIAPIAINMGGSGEMIYLVTFQNGEAVIEDRDIISLGDRVQMETLSVNGETVTVTYMDHAADQAMVEAPTVKVKRMFSVDPMTMQLTEMADDTK